MCIYMYIYMLIMIISVRYHRMISDLLWENSILFERLQRKLAEANLRNEERRQLVRKLVARVNRSVLNHRRALPPCIVPAAGRNVVSIEFL